MRDVGSRVRGSKPDAYFDPKAYDILSAYFLAAALGELLITQVYLWVTEQVSQEPIEILKVHDHEQLIVSCVSRIAELGPGPRLDSWERTIPPTKGPLR
ncbi:hypothetical protein [Arthrobacter sp. UYEF3]|uniref:hypothetical protein n=1 Tax=Arthrobacter sp. UYEF3 TaxID=1756365 RepID=UPI00339363F4